MVGKAGKSTRGKVSRAGKKKALVSELPLPDDVKELLLKDGITELYPPQARGIDVVLSGRGLVLAVPTSSGKSLVAYLACVQGALAGSKALYIVPLKALAQEKYRELKIFEKLGLRVKMSVGDPTEAGDAYLRDADMVVATSEKVDALLRQGTGWLGEVGVLVADEVHLMNDPGRGPTLEVLLARMRRLVPEVQVVALSATIPNSAEIAGWLDAEHVSDDFRPVKLKEGVYEGGAIYFTDGTRRKVPMETDQVTSLARDVIREGGQCLVFVNSRRSAESLAGKLGAAVNLSLSSSGREELMGVSDKLRAGQSERTAMGDTLRRAVETGVAFHHAGLSPSQRGVVEMAFKRGTLKVITATPTLAAGVNLPARRVIIRDVMRYQGSEGGMVPLPVMEIKQMAGRAGRPRFDPYGEAVLLARSRDHREQLFDMFINAPVEKVTSKLDSQSSLRMHTLGSVATGSISSFGELKEFFASTFYAYQGDRHRIEREVERAVCFLDREGLITGAGACGPDEDELHDAGSTLLELKVVSGDELYGKGLDDGTPLSPTEFGIVTSHLYLDPSSAVILKRALDTWAFREREPDLFSLLHVICMTPDVFTFHLKQRDVGILETKLLEHEDELLLKIPEIGSDEYLEFLSAAKSASLLEEWCLEIAEDSITSRYGVGPGDIWNLTDTTAWILNGMDRLRRLFPVNNDHVIRDTYLRVRHGIREELLGLVRLKGVGRVRARNLSRSGFTGVEELREADYRRIARVKGIGAILAASIKKQLGQEVSDDTRAEAMASDAEGISTNSGGGTTQKNLLDF